MHADEEVDGLIDKEVVPCLWDIVGLVEDDHREDNLGNDNRYARCGGDPGIDIGNSTGIALYKSQCTDLSLSIEYATQTKKRAGLAGVRMDVQWYLMRSAFCKLYKPLSLVNHGKNHSLSPSGRIYRTQFGHCQTTAPNHNEDHDDAIYQCHRTTLSNGQSHGGRHSSPTIADVPSNTDYIQWSNVSFGLLGESENG